MAPVIPVIPVIAIGAVTIILPVIPPVMVPALRPTVPAVIPPVLTGTLEVSVSVFVVATVRKMTPQMTAFYRRIFGPLVTIDTGVVIVDRCQARAVVVVQLAADQGSEQEIAGVVVVGFRSGAGQAQCQSKCADREQVPHGNAPFLALRNCSITPCG
jgi:predicted anti-sigma-YlaC factor YlaD